MLKGNEQEAPSPDAFQWTIPGLGSFYVEQDKHSLAHASQQTITEENGEFTIFLRDRVILFTPEDHPFYRSTPHGNVVSGRF